MRQIPLHLTSPVGFTRRPPPTGNNKLHHPTYLSTPTTRSRNTKLRPPGLDGGTADQIYWCKNVHIADTR